LLGQSSTTGVLDGTVVDPTQAVIQGATLTLTSVDKAAVRTAVTDARGVYRFLLLPPGAYELKVEKSGFSPNFRKGIVISVGETVVVDVQLNVGGETSVIDVSAEATVVETERS